MESLSIRVQTLEDVKVEPNVMPEVAEGNVTPAKNLTVCIMEDMTVEHKSGVLFYLEMPDGSFVAHNITENLFDGIISAYKGALARFEDLRESRKSGGTPTIDDDLEKPESD